MRACHSEGKFNLLARLNGVALSQPNEPSGFVVNAQTKTKIHSTAGLVADCCHVYIYTHERMRTFVLLLCLDVGMRLDYDADPSIC